MIGKILKLFDWRVQSNSSRESVFDLKYKLKTFCYLKVFNQNLTVSVQGNFWFTKGMLFVKALLTALNLGKVLSNGMGIGIE